MSWSRFGMDEAERLQRILVRRRPQLFSPEEQRLKKIYDLETLQGLMEEVLRENREKGWIAQDDRVRFRKDYAQGSTAIVPAGTMATIAGWEDRQAIVRIDAGQPMKREDGSLVPAEHEQLRTVPYDVLELVEMVR